MNYFELAKQAGFVEYELDDGTTKAFDKRYATFADLVAAHEREAIIKLIEAPALVPFAQNEKGGCMMCGFTPKLAAKYIRARGTT
jgi:hypothetical protein